MDDSIGVLIWVLGGEVWAQTEIVSAAGAGLRGVEGGGVDGRGGTPRASLNYWVALRVSSLFWAPQVAAEIDF